MWERGIQLSEGGKGKKKAELFDLCKKAAAMKQIKLASYVSSAKDRQKTFRGEITNERANFQNLKF